MSLRQTVFATLLISVTLITLELLAFGAIGTLETQERFRFQRISDRLVEVSERARQLVEHQPDSLLALDAEIGWIYRPNYRGDLYSSNSLGARGSREYGPRAAANRLRIAAFGDSFVHANEVSDEAAWSSRLEALDPAVEVVNFGVGGFGTDQALMLFRRQVKKVQPDIVILGFAEVDLARNVNRYRRFIAARENPLFKPRFRLDDADNRLILVPAAFSGRDGLLKIKNDPARLLESANHDFFYEPLEWENPLYDHSALVRLFSTLGARGWRSGVSRNRLYRGGRINRSAEAVQVTAALVRAFEQEASGSGFAFIFLILPLQASDIWNEEPPRYTPLKEILSDLPVFDAREEFREDASVTPQNLWAPGSHYSAEGNSSLARFVHRILKKQKVLQ